MAEDEIEMIRDGSGLHKSAEDSFDAALGTLSKLEVILGFRPEGDPTDVAVRQTEGWILRLEA